MVLRARNHTGSDAMDLNNLSKTKHVIPTVVTPGTKTESRYGGIMCSPFMPGYGAVPVIPFPKTDSSAQMLDSTSPPVGSKYNNHKQRNCSLNSTSSSSSYGLQTSSKRNGFSINELLDNKDDFKSKSRVDQETSRCDPGLTSPNSSSTKVDQKLLEKCKNLDRLSRHEYPRGSTTDVIERIRDTSYFHRFVPAAAFSHPSLISPAGSLAFQLGLQPQPGLISPSSVYHPFHPPRSSSPPPLGVPIPVPVYLRGRAGATPSEGSRVAKKCRRSRTVFTELQLMGLEKRFEKQKYLSTPDRLELAETLGLSQLQVKTWYQNRRMKWKKQVLQGGGQEAPTKPKGRPKKSELITMEQSPEIETDQSDESDRESMTSPLSHTSSPLPPQTARVPSPKPLMTLQ